MKLRKWLTWLLLAAMMLSLAACGEKEPTETRGTETGKTEETQQTTEPSSETEGEGSETPSDSESETTDLPTETEAPSETETPTETEPAEELAFWQEEHVVFPLYFGFSSGAGGWGTELILEEDGSFTGSYHDSEMGSTGEGYPNGTVYICNFSGKFAPCERLDMYTYGTRLLKLTQEKPEGEEWIEDGIRYITSYPYGLNDGEEFQIYLPNTPATMLTEEMYPWWPGRYGEGRETLGSYGLCNMANEQCFFTEIRDVEYPMSFFLSSGAGAWYTDLYLEVDGSFTGEYHDGELGSTGEGYPNGTVYVCEFSGSFGQGQRLDDYTYGLKLEELTLSRPVGEEWIEDGVRYVTAMPVGLEEGADYSIYLPNMPIELLTEDERMWWPYRFEEDHYALDAYGLYHIGEGYGFYCMTE